LLPEAAKDAGANEASGNEGLTGSLFNLHHLVISPTTAANK